MGGGYAAELSVDAWPLKFVECAAFNESFIFATARTTFCDSSLSSAQ